MKIKKHGKKYEKESSRSELFKCDNCGCEFKAKEDEYYIDYGRDNLYSTTSISSITISSTVMDYYICSCPECHKIVKNPHERKSYNDYPITLCGSNSLSTENEYDINLGDVK